MPLVTCPDCVRQVSDAAPTCPKCGRPIAGNIATSAAPVAPTGPDPTQAPAPSGNNLGLAIGVGVAISFGAIALLGSGSSGGHVPTVTAADMPPAAHAQNPTPATVETKGEHIQKLRFAEAVGFAKPMMADTADTDSAGAALLALWATSHLKWADVYVANDETSYALAQKAPDDARGKRVCIGGRIVQIEEGKTESGGRMSVGLLRSLGGNLFRFLAAGSSGGLVEGSDGRVCGVVTGKYDYANGGGGTGHALALVGMWELPENKPKSP